MSHIYSCRIYDRDVGRVYVYKNLHVNKWSVKCAESGHPDCEYGLVVAHCDRIAIIPERFQTSEIRRQRAIAEGRRSVHAGIYGRVTKLPGRTLKKRLSYSPFKAPYYFDTDTGAPILTAEIVYFCERGATYRGVQPW